MDQNLNRAGSGNFGFNVVGGQVSDHQLFQNRIVDGMFVGTPTTASAQATGTGAFSYRVNVEKGIAIVNGKIKEYAAQADLVLQSGTTGNAILAVGQSINYSIVLFYNLGDNTIVQRIFKGAVATTGAQLFPTKAEIEAGFAPGTVWFRLANVTVNRTGDVDTMTFVYDNTVRPLLIPQTVQTLN
jgi:hypothetical protein